jgi:hypothetical protein
MRYLIGALVLCAAAWWLLHGEPDYPNGWAKPDWTLLPHRGGCPDLNATFTQVNSELSWLLGHNPDSSMSLQRWQDSRAAITQSPNGDSVTISFSLSPKGFEEFRRREIRYNGDVSFGPVVAEPMTLRRGVDFDCAGNWMYGKHFAQESESRGSQRRELKVGRDGDGGLIAGARTTSETSIGWGDSARISLGRHDEMKWYRWPKDDPDTDAALAKLQSVDLHRYGWKNGTGVPIRFTSFYVEPICVRFSNIDPTGRAYSVTRHGPHQRKSDIECPEGWGEFDLGQVLRADMDTAKESGWSYRVEWFPWSGRNEKPNVIEVTDVQTLPLMPH